VADMVVRQPTDADVPLHPSPTPGSDRATGDGD